ncbi:sigma-70 family RNA polymerase sigma factor [Streptomyces sp. NPDC005820]|uniref:sigma-70 family RNA polymerase sigma factor n=1 Tax=Streptomyces sp. NPDC005820 TaxID=3157069 RepID=UPI0033E74086
MTDRSSAVPAQASSTAAYARIYEEQQPRLVAYARSLTRNAWTAEDLVAEAHFRVWRRLAEGHEIENVPAYLRTTVRHLAIASGTAVRETPRDPQADERAERAEPGGHEGDPAEQVSQVDLVVRVLGQLPERWVKALWLAEAEGQPLAAIGPQLGTKEGATAVLLHRAREGMRQAFLRTQTGAPEDPACQVHWARMPAYVRGAATPRQGERLLGHVDACDDCRARLAALMRANDRLPAIVAPALLLFALGGTGKFLMAFTAGSAGAAAAAGGHGAGLLHGVRHAAVGGSKAQAAVAAGALVAGAAAFVLVIGSGESAPIPAQRTPVADAPVSRMPVAETPANPPAQAAVPVEAAEDRSPSVRVADAAGDIRTDTVPSTAEAPSSSGTGVPGPTGGGKSTDEPSSTGTPPEEEQTSPPADEGTADDGSKETPQPTTPTPEIPQPETPQPEPPQTSDPEPRPGDDGADQGTGDDDPGCPSGGDQEDTGHGKARHGDQGHHRGGRSGHDAA